MSSIERYDYGMLSYTKQLLHQAHCCRVFCKRPIATPSIAFQWDVKSTSWIFPMINEFYYHLFASALEFSHSSTIFKVFLLENASSCWQAVLESPSHSHGLTDCSALCSHTKCMLLDSRSFLWFSWIPSKHSASWDIFTPGWELLDVVCLFLSFPFPHFVEQTSAFCA